MWLSCFPFLLWNRLIGKGNMGDTCSDSEPYKSDAKELDSKPSTSVAKELDSRPSKYDANTSSDSKPSKSDAKELDSKPSKSDAKELDSKPCKSVAKELDSKPSKSDANTSSDSKPCKSDAKELDSKPSKSDAKELDSKPCKSVAKELDSKPSKSDVNTSSDLKPHKSDSKEHYTPSEQQVISPKDYILQKAQPFARNSQTYDDPTIWGVLTAINENAIRGMKDRGCQGHCIYLKMAKHCIGLVLTRWLTIPNKVVNNDYGIYLTRVDGEEKEHIGSLYPAVFLCDTSAFATYVNWKRLTKDKPVQIHHGDIISLCGPPDDGNARGFVYQLAYRYNPWHERSRSNNP
ncbi:uncharacterized protein LOC120009401 isoform X2 [Tripterygium wilfordii]|uniref:uncharacterized protein LOC120009401 isoform X2 n=1 Tax=Tripterygium wilfordii TaxID=458696 RepID=UPI0018F8321E|nr:uncharacterized protein LOC120009401 isoform X2 [Tripterygium wilfordii]